MSKADYEKCLLAIAKKNMQLALEFLRSLPFIGNTITRTQLIKMKLQMEQKTFRRLQPVVREGDSLNTFYIVRSGEFEVTKRMVVRLGARTREEKVRQEEVNEGKTSNVEAVLSQKIAEQNSLQLF